MNQCISASDSGQNRKLGFEKNPLVLMRTSYELMVIEDSKDIKNPLKKVTKLMMSILFVAILATCVVIGLLIKYTSPQTKIETRNLTMEVEPRNNSVEEIDTILEITTEGVGIDLVSLENTSYVENKVTSTFASTIKGRLINF